MYLHLASPRTHEITCPWAHQHAEGEGQGATFTEPDDTHPLGTFKCAGTHQSKVRARSLVDWLEVPIELARGKDIIRLHSGEMNRIAAGAEQVLVKMGGYYQAGSTIVRLKRDVDTGDIGTEPVNEAALAKALSAGADWMKWDGRQKKAVRSDPPLRHVSMLFKAQQFEHLPLLKGIARQPYLTDSGELVVAPGYNPATRMFGGFDPAKFHLPEPTEAAARESLDALDALLDEFHFRAPADRSAALAAMLTAAVRSYLPVAPAFSISASSPGSGKSYLASLITPFAGPGAPMNVSYPVKAEEASKVVLSVLMQSPAVVLFDDMQTNWIPHGVINRMLTSGTISERVLGVSKTATVTTSTLVLGTGNNVEPDRDMRRRVITIYLSPMSATPATLSYNGRPVDAVRSDRGRYVGHALTVVRAWIAAGRPNAEVPDIASFEAWSDLCRQPLLWLGRPDSATSLIEQVKADPALEELGALMMAWHMEFGLTSAMLRTVIARATDDRDGDLWQAMVDLPFVEKDRVNPTAFGKYLKRHANRVVGPLRLVQVPNSERNAWAVVPVPVEPSGYTPPPKRSAEVRYPPARRAPPVQDASKEVF